MAEFFMRTSWSRMSHGTTCSNVCFRRDTNEIVPVTTPKDKVYAGKPTTLEDSKAQSSERAPQRQMKNGL